MRRSTCWICQICITNLSTSQFSQLSENSKPSDVNSFNHHTNDYSQIFNHTKKNTHNSFFTTVLKISLYIPLYLYLFIYLSSIVFSSHDSREFYSSLAVTSSRDAESAWIPYVCVCVCVCDIHMRFYDIYTDVGMCGIYVCMWSYAWCVWSMG